jgi:hypothetical protein
MSYSRGSYLVETKPAQALSPDAAERMVKQLEAGFLELATSGEFPALVATQSVPPTPGGNPSTRPLTANACGRLNEIADAAANTAEAILDHKIGFDSPSGYILRMTLAGLLQALNTAAAGVKEYASLHPDELNPDDESLSHLFEHDWDYLTHRLVDEHAFRDNNEGDELS